MQISERARGEIILPMLHRGGKAKFPQIFLVENLNPTLKDSSVFNSILLQGHPLLRKPGVGGAHETIGNPAPSLQHTLVPPPVLLGR